MDVESLRTGIPLDAKQHPTVAFEAHVVDGAGGGGIRLAGDLTIKGIMRPFRLESKLKVVERRDSTVLAEHYTHTGRIVETTLETVRFDRPDRVEFRLLRGPVPHVSEAFDLRNVEDGTELDYTGELGTDLWAIGRWWGRRVGERWEAAVRDSLAAIKNEAERRAR